MTDSDIAIRVENLSKRYRIGLKEEVHDTFAGMLADYIRRPVQNLRRLRRLTRFSENGRDPEDILWALKDVSFEVKRGEVVGVIGRNGAGKSTLLKILSRITHPTSGRFQMRGRVSSLLEVGTGFHSELTGRENIYLNGTILGMRKVEIDSKFDEIVDFSGVEKFIDTPVKRYSSGMKVRLAFSVAAHLEPEILLVDEVLAVGDVEFQKKCIGKMNSVANEGRTVLFVSHNMNAILDLCLKCLVFQNGENKFQGVPEKAIEFYLDSFSQRRKANINPHILYQSSQETQGVVPRIDCVEMLDKFSHPKTQLATWDSVRFRMHYLSDKEYKHGSFLFDIRDTKNQRLMVLDSGLITPIRQGKHHIDCFIPKLELSAGDYFLGGGLALSRSGWLWYDDNLGPFRVQGKDVYQLGRPPESSRMLFATRYEWLS